MSENDGLANKRQEIQGEIKAGRYKSLADILLDGTGRLMQQLAFSKTPPAFWYNSVAFVLLTLLISAIIAKFFGDPAPNLSSDEILNMFLGGYLGLLGGSGIMIAAAIIHHKLLATLSNNILAAIEAVEDLSNLQRWLANTFNIKTQLLFSLAPTLIFFPPLIFFRSLVTEGIDLAVYLVAIIAGFQAFVASPVALAAFSMPYRLGNYRLKLFAADPSSSEVIDALSDTINTILFVTAIIVTLFTVWLFAFNPWVVAVAGLPLPWGIMIIIFASSHYALAKIVNKAKWRTLNGIQAQIEELQMKENVLSQKTLEHINELLDYHHRIQTTRNSALNIRAGLSLLQSLLLPLIGLLLANLLDILDLLSQFTAAD